MADRAPTRRRRKPPRSTLALRWLAVGGIALVALLYYRPLRTYSHVRSAVAARSAEVRALRAQNRALEAQLSTSAQHEALVRQARRLGLVKPGERLFIVKGIGPWLRAHSRIEDGG